MALTLELVWENEPNLINAIFFGIEGGRAIVAISSGSTPVLPPITAADGVTVSEPSRCGDCGFVRFGQGADAI